MESVRQKITIEYSGKRTGNDHLLKRNHRKKKIVKKRRIDSREPIPRFSMVENGREAAFSVRVSVTPVRKFKSNARGWEINSSGYVRGIKQPIIIKNDDNGTIIRFVKINKVGNLLKADIVKGRVPAWAKRVTATDCHILSASQLLYPGFK
jgi:hypothetical protein